MDVRTRLIQSNETGSLLDTIYDCLSPDQNVRSALAADLASLHNEGLIDVVNAFENLNSTDTSSGHDFFLTRRVFEEALPELIAPVSSIMRCVLHLYQRAGRDMAAATIIEGYVAFCAKHISRPLEALAVIQAQPEKYATLLTATLAAGSRIDHANFLTQAIALCDDENTEIKREAVFSIGCLNWKEGIAVPDSAIDVLEQISIAEADDQILARLITSAFRLLRQDRTKTDRIVEIIEATLSKGSEYTLHSASEPFGFNTEELPPSLLEVLLSYLAKTKPTHKGTLDNIDYGIAHLLNKSGAEKAFRFLEEILQNHPQELTMETFDNAAHAILSNKAHVSKILTRWLLLGERALGIGVQTIISLNRNDDPLLDIDPSELQPNDPQRIIFLARKAIGYLFMQPISAASILISLMRQTDDDDTLTELGALLFDPLLINYTGKARDFVAQLSTSESGKVKETIDNSLKAINTYLDELRAVGELAALQPSETQREAYHRHFTLQMAESMKAAEAQSVLLQLVSKRILLYGNKSISYVRGIDGTSQRMETPLQRHGTEIEFPRMGKIDPFGMDYMLRIFRNERLVS